MKLYQSKQKFTFTKDGLNQTIDSELTIDVAEKDKILLQFTYGKASSNIFRFKTHGLINHKILEMLKSASISEIESKAKSISFEDTASLKFKIKYGREIVANFWIDRIKIIFEHETEEFDLNGEKFTKSNFYLSDNAIAIIDRLYNFSSDFYKDEPGMRHWTAHNEFKDYKDFGDVKCLLGFYFFDIKKSDELKIIREPVIQILHQKIPEKQITGYVDIICSLISLFSKRNISVQANHIYIEDEHIYNYFDIKNEKVDSDFFGAYETEFSSNPIKLLERVDTGIAIKYIQYSRQYVRKFFEISNAELESKFMIYFNIIDKIRTLLVKNENPELEKSEDFVFSVPKKKIENKIKEQLKNISEIIDEKDRDAFLTDIKDKVGFLKKRGVKSQFNKFFETLRVDLEDFNIDIDEVVRLRNSIFHGNTLPQDKKIDMLVIRLRYLVEYMLFYILGIRDIEISSYSKQFLKSEV